MFAGRMDEVLACAEAGATRTSLKDREQFLPALRVVEEFAKQKGRIVGGNGATLLWTRFKERRGSDPIPLDAYHYTLYSPSPLSDGSELARRVYALDPKGLTQYTVCLPRVLELPSGEIKMEALVNTGQREIVRIKGLPQFRGVKVYDILAPDKVPLLFTPGTKAPCLGPEMQLIGIYRDLCNPSLVGDWAGLLKFEKILRDFMVGNFREKIASITGGRAAVFSPKKPRAEKGGASSVQKIIERYVSKEGRMVLFRPDSEGRAYARLRCTTVFSLEEEQETLAELAEQEKEEVQFLVNDPQLPTDRRLRRLTMYRIRKKGSSSREPVLDVYNIANYEAVPYLHLSNAELKERSFPVAPMTVSLKIATAFGRARFILVDIWTIQLLLKLGSVSNEHGQTLLRQLFKEFEEIQFTTSEAFPALPQHFLGRIEPADLAEKREALASQKIRSMGKNKRKITPYYPIWGQK